MKLLGNCLACAVAAWLLNPVATRIACTRNRSGRLHFFWIRNGRRFEFYTAGASRLPYWRNALRIGEIREIGRTLPPAARPIKGGTQGRQALTRPSQP